MNPTVAGEILFSNDRTQCVLVYKFSTGRYSFPKGKVEPNEHWIKGGQRERYEETGIDTKNVQYLGVTIQEKKPNGHLSCTYMISSLVPDVKTNNYTTENKKEEARWMTVEAALALPDKEFMMRRRLLLKEAANLANIYKFSSQPPDVKDTKAVDQSVQISKTLSYILRHGALKHGLTVRSDGSVLVDKLLSLDQFSGCTFEILQNIVSSNDKQRFALYKEGAAWYIKANQGHSHDVGSKIDDAKMTLLTKAEDCVHGTTRGAYKLIKDSGIKVMGRKHIHLAIPGGKSGYRATSSVIIHIDMETAIKDGIQFYKSDNDVILTCGINGVLPSKYFKKIEFP